ncbi:saccharopine dehydrogenase-like oxidoreductase [Folsomia candida]|nr:saccharopine dehydrogenase-like oxidoreductase [Folsomia candida]XP_021953729.1 saccharopine dehydrogenase-like oxidoreductase [Folsomia candida]
MGRKYNIVVFGAAGFTGKHLILEIVKTLDEKDEQFSWAVSGRSTSKLDVVLQEMSKASGKDLSNVDKIVADVADRESLRNMARQADVVLNCVGPYLLYGGDEVVQACIQEGTHHLDLSGEPQFLEKVQLKYNKDAEESGAYIIGCCGFDSIPADYGSVYLENNFYGQLNSVVSYMQIKKGTKVTKLNFGTWHSGVIMCNRFFETFALKRKLYPNPYYKFQYKVPYRPIVYCEEVQGWCINLPFPDARVMERTQRYKYYNEKRRPIQTQAFMRSPNFFLAILMAIGSLLLGILAQFKFGVRLLENYPRLFSMGMVTKDGPTKEEMDSPFSFTLVGKGWDKSTKPTSDGLYASPPNKTLILKVSGINPGYGGTVTIMLHAGLAIIKERNLMPSKGGVYTPGTAFARTSLAEKLTRHGVSFTLTTPQ